MATTIKVSQELRDRINLDAGEQGLTAAGLIERLLDAYDRRRRMEAFGRAFRSADEDYWRDFHDWDVALDDGLRDA
jgi:hypothetical protein